MLPIVAVASFVCALVVAGAWTLRQSADSAQHQITYDIVLSALALVVIEISVVALFGAGIAEYCGAVLVPFCLAARMAQTVAMLRA